MCDTCATSEPVISRRSFGLITTIGAVGFAPIAAGAHRVPGSPLSMLDLPPPAVIARDVWAQGREPKGEIPVEDPKFLLVHHTADPGNDYTSEEVPGLLQGIFDFHTGATKGWPDVAYNFFIDNYGRIWEGRQGSLAGPVRGSATGGNQGWSQLCCFLGNFETEMPTPDARQSMVALLAWLADRYAIDTSPGATVEVTSLGSNRFPAGTPIIASTIAGHRDMSMTTCPGDSAYQWVTGDLPRAVTQLRHVQPPRTTAAPAQPSTSQAPETTLGPHPDDDTGAVTATSRPAPEGTEPITGTDRPNAAERSDDQSSDPGMPVPVKAALAAGAAVAMGAGAAGMLKARRADHRHVRHVGASWVLSEVPDDRRNRQSVHPDRTAPDGMSDTLHVGTDGAVAWVIRGGWPSELVETALKAFRSAAAAEDLRAAGADFVGHVGPSPDGRATIVLFSMEQHDAASTSHVLGLGRAQVSVRRASGSELIACPVDQSFAAPVSFLVNLGPDLGHVAVEPKPGG